jgi:hypothetical protein
LPHGLGRILNSILSSLCLLAIALSAVARAADQLPQIPDATKQAAALGSDQVQQIDSAVAAVAKTIADGSDPTAQSAGRVWLVNGSFDATGNAGSAVYLHAYAQSVNNNLLAMVSAGANFRAKLQAGLAAQQIAEAAKGTELVPLATALLRDPAAAVGLVGMKAAGALMPAILNENQLSPDENKLLDQMLATIAAHPRPPLGGLIVEEAYNALQQPVFGQGNALAKQITPVLVPMVFKLAEQRLAAYQTAPPDNPQADSTGLVILFSRDVWLGGDGISGLTADQQLETLRLAVEYIGATAKWAQTARTSGTIDNVPFIDALQTDGKELVLFSDPNTGVVPDQTLSTAATDLSRLGSGSGATTIAKASSDVTAALQNFTRSKFGKELAATR